MMVVMLTLTMVMTTKTIDDDDDDVLWWRRGDDDNFDEYDDLINYNNDDDDVLWWRTFAVVASRAPSPVSDHRETSYKHLLRQTVPSSSICTIFIFVSILCETPFVKQ